MFLLKNQTKILLNRIPHKSDTLIYNEYKVDVIFSIPTK